MKLFQGYDEPLARYVPAWPIDAPGMPLPGKDFVTYAELLEPDIKTFIKGAGNKAKLKSFPSVLQELYDRAVYEYRFSIDVNNRGVTYNAEFLPGHVWGDGQDQTELSEDIDIGSISSKFLPNINYGPPIEGCDVMVIGKMPGSEEISIGRNFTGDSGALLKNTLDELEVEDYDNWYVTNLIKFPKLDPRTNSIPPSFIKDCLPILHMEMRLVKPKFILLLGSEAVSYVLGKSNKLANTVGEIFEYKIDLRKSESEPENFHIAKVMTCSHPARVVRSPDLKPQFVEELRLFTKLLAGSSVGRKELDLEHHIVKDEQTLSDLVDKILAEKDNSVIAVDAEWHGEQPFESGSYLRSIQFSHKPKFAICVALNAAGGIPIFKNKYGQVDLKSALPHMERLCKSTETRKTRIVGHFFRADLPWLEHYGLNLKNEFNAPKDRDDKFGWELTKTEGGFDTGLAAHSVDETGRFKLEIQAASLLGTPRYDSQLQKWKVAYCKEKRLKADDLEGYGDCPDEILYPYAAYDADVTRRLFEVYNGHPNKILIRQTNKDFMGFGLLDYDAYGMCSREAFWISMRASPGFLEMEQTGVYADRKRGEELTELYSSKCSDLNSQLQILLNWPNFNHKSDVHRKELLFGEKYNGKVNKSEPGKIQRVRPEKAMSLYMTPIKSTNGKDWTNIISKGTENKNSPSCDKECLSILAARDKTGIVSVLRDVRFLDHVFHSTLRKPKIEISSSQVGTVKRDKFGNIEFSGGLLSYICSDGRIRTHLFQTKETGRASSSRPNLQNLGKKREVDYKRILGDDYRYPLRTILSCPPGSVLIEADYSGAEVAGAAWMSDDDTLMQAVSDPSFDMHSSIAVEAFQLDCEPNKDGLKKAGLSHLRNAAKAVIFGYFYGQGAEAAARKAKEETGKEITVEDCRRLQNRLEKKFPKLVSFFVNCRARTKDPGWICNSFGRFRRFKQTSDSQAQGESERQGMNFPIQSMIADAVSKAIDNFMSYRESNPDIYFKLILQIHDAILFEVPVRHAERLWSEVIPKCMIDQVPIYPVTLAGIPTGKGPYRLEVGRDMYIRWGEEIYKDEMKAFDLPEFMGAKRNADDKRPPRIEEYCSHAFPEGSSSF